MQIQLVRSATLRLSIGGATFLIDPWLAPRGGGRSYAGTRRSPLVELPMPAAEVVAEIDAVLVSHLHSDHFDEAARAVLPKDVPIVCHARDADVLAGFGFTDVRATATGLRIGAVTIAVTGGRHGPDPVLPEMGEVCGFVLRAPGEANYAAAANRGPATVRSSGSAPAVRPARRVDKAKPRQSDACVVLETDGSLSIVLR